MRRPAKICIDGKKLSIGIGEQLGEDLNNHESKPTLQERKQRPQKEMASLDDLLIAIEEDKMNVDLVKHEAFDSLQIMSQRLREVKTGKLVTQKKLENVQKKLNSNEDWMNLHMPLRSVTTKHAYCIWRTL